MSKKEKKKPLNKKEKLIINLNCKSYMQYMLDHGVKKTDNLNFKRLNCDIPKELHTWLNIYARSNESEYTSMTEIVINVLGKFAKERGFKIKKCGCYCE